MAASSLHDLLALDGFRRPNPDAHSLDCRSLPSRLTTSTAAAAATTVSPSSPDSTSIDAAAARAVISVLSGYSGRFLKDPHFRRSLREKCSACLSPSKGSAHSVLTNLQLGIDSIERLADELPNSTKDAKIRSLRNSIRLLSVVASLNTPKSRAAALYTCGVPNSHLSACAQLYLSVVYKIERNDKASAKHLLQVFRDASYLARRNLLPDLWEHFFGPHLLHLKVWYTGEVAAVSGWEVEDREKRLKGLNRAYNDQLDVGTSQFALYYKEWLSDGAKVPPLPSVALPSRPSWSEPEGKRSVSGSPKSINRSLLRAVFGPLERGDIGDDRVVIGGEVKVEKESCMIRNSAHSGMGIRQRKSMQERPLLEATPTPRKSYSFRLLSCRSDPDRGAIRRVQIANNESLSAPKESNRSAGPINLSHAINLISNSDSLKECEMAIRVVAKAWMDSPGDFILEAALSTMVIEGLLEISFTSKDDEVLELTISILAVLVSRNDVNRQVVLNGDPQLEIFLRLLKNKNIFLKAAVLLYLMKPKAKQMLSLDWMPLVLQVLDCGDRIQTLFTVQCCPRLAAFYFLDQLLMGFDVDRNVENAKQMIALGGLGLLNKRLEMGDVREKKSSASLLAACVRADGSCREYLAANIKKASIIQLLMGNQLKSSGIALSLLSELVCLNRTTRMINFLNGLKNDGFLNTMHVLLVYLQQAPLDQRPLAAAVLLQLDLLGDPFQYSFYREEGIDAIVAALERSLHNKKVQEHCSRALLILGGRFSCSGEAMTESWLLKRAGLDDGPADSFNSKEILVDDFERMEEEEKALDNWLRKLAIVLLTSGNKRLLVALSNCIADGIPSLARSCLVTVAWMSSSLFSLQNANRLKSLACLILAPTLLESLNYDRSLEERVLSSLSLLNFARHPECLPRLFPFSKETLASLQDLAQSTWTAKELLFACCR